MRITYLHQYFATPDSPGGTRSYEFARRLVARGHRVTVVTSPAMLPPPLRDVRRTTRTTVDGIRLVVVPVAYANEMGNAQRMAAFARFAARAVWHACRLRADVVLASSTPLTVAVPGLLASRLRRAPLVFEVRDLWPELPIALGALRHPVLRGAARALELAAYRGARTVVALSDGMAAGVRARGVPADRVVVIPNAADVDRFDVPAEAGHRARAALGVPAGAPLLLYCGSMGRVYGLAYLVDLAAALRGRVPDVRVVLVGSGLERPAVEARARALGLLGTTVLLHDPVPKRALPALLAACDVTCSLTIPVPELEHNSANKVFDAFAAGRPLAINYGGWQADLLRATGAGVVLPPRDPVGGARILADLLADPERRAAAGAAGRRLARERFDRDRLADDLEAVLLRAAGAP